MTVQAISSMKSNIKSLDSTSYGVQAWLVTLTASLFFFYDFIQLNLFNSISTDLMRDFHINAGELGQMSSMFFYANSLFLFPAGMLLDRFSTKKILLAAMGLTVFATLLFAFSTTYTMAAISRFLDGVSASFCFLSCIRLASRWFPPKKMAFVTGVIVTMAMLGGLVAQTPMALLAGLMGWRHAIFVDAGLGGVITFIILAFLQDRPINSQVAVHAEQVQLKSLGLWRSFKLVLRNRYNWFGGLYTALLNLPVFLLGALWGIDYLVKVHHISLVEASYATTFFFLGVIFGSPFFGWLSDYMGRRVLPMIIGAILSIAVLLILILSHTLTLNQIIILFFLIGFVTSSQVLSYPVIAELNPIYLTGTATSIDSVTIMVSGAIVQPLFGWLMDLHWNHLIVNGEAIYASSDFLRAMWIMPIACIIGLGIAFFIKETYCQSQIS